MPCNFAMFCSANNLSNLSDTFPHLIIRACAARATKTSPAIKMNACFFSFVVVIVVCLFYFFFKRFSRFPFISLKMANIGKLQYGVLGTAPNFGLREEIKLVPVFTSSKHRRKRKFNVVFVQVLRKSALHVQNLSFFMYLLGSIV